MMGFVAPAGTRLFAGDLFIGAIRGIHASSWSRLEGGLCAATGRQSAEFYSTGRAAMTVAFEAMKQVAHDRDRNEVIIPGYTCYSVPASIERAGLVPRLCDVDPETLGPDLRSLASIDLRRVLAIVSSNLYGLPNALQEMEDFARDNRLFMLDDAAQALAARVAQRPVGGFGDIGLLSFDKGKNITTLHGGCLVMNPCRLQEAVVSITRQLARPSPIDTGVTSLKLAAYAVLLKPLLYSLVRRFPLGLGETPYEVDYPILRFNRGLTGFASRQVERLYDITGTRAGNADRILKHLKALPILKMPRIAHGVEPVYARFPVLVDPVMRPRLILALEREGVGATVSYPRALIDVPEVARRLPRDQEATPGAREVAKRLVTLPTHGYVPNDFGRTLAGVIDRVVATRSSLG